MPRPENIINSKLMKELLLCRKLQKYGFMLSNWSTYRCWSLHTFEITKSKGIIKRLKNQNIVWKHKPKTHTAHIILLGYGTGDERSEWILPKDMISNSQVPIVVISYWLWIWFHLVMCLRSAPRFLRKGWAFEIC